MLRKTLKFISLLSVLPLIAYKANAQIVPDTSIIGNPALDYKIRSNFSAATTNQTSSFENNQLPDSVNNNIYDDRLGANNNTQLFIKTKNSKKYGLSAKLETELSASQNRGRFDVDELFAFAKSDAGKFQIGNALAVNQKMKVGPSTFARAAGGINGHYLRYVNFPTLNSANANSNIKLPNFIVLAQSPIGHGGYAQGFYNENFNKDRLRIIRDNSFKGAEDALKLNYYSPRVSGIKLGLSYTHDSSQKGAATTIFGNNATAVQDVISYGLNYSDSFDNIGYAISLTGENGTVKGSNQVKRNNLASYDVAATVVYFGFTFGASYGSWGSSLQEKDGQGIYSCDYDASSAISSQDCSNNGKNFGNAHYYTLGAAYEFGPIEASLTSIKSTFQKNEYDAISLGVDYKLRRGLIPYLEFTRYKFKANQVQASDINSNQIQDNEGYVGLAGVILSF